MGADRFCTSSPCTGLMELKKKKGIFFLAVLGSALIFFVAGGGWWWWARQPAGEADQARQFVVKKGESLDSIARRLRAEGLIRSVLAFRIQAVNLGLARDIQAGSFRLDAGLALNQLILELTHGAEDRWITFPEGWRREQYAEHLAVQLENFDKDKFLQLTIGKEGRLFPDTYLVPQEISPTGVVSILENNFHHKLTTEMESLLAATQLTTDEVVVLASMVEREAKLDEDRLLIAGILLKRWRAGWPLQVDATVQYAKADQFQASGRIIEDFSWWPPVSRADLQATASPYNTYLNPGLPPAPICNPGLASLTAAADPQESEYWYYLADKTGRSHYAVTLKEHQANISKYLSSD